MQEHLELQPLTGLRVVDLTHGIAGPYCTKLLAAYGADVIKIERPETGDFVRSVDPFPNDIPHLDKSGLFLHLNTNKRSIVLDLTTAQGVETVKGLVREADIVVENFRPGVIDQLGLSYSVLSGINPNLIMTSISNFGQTGPYRDYLGSELTIFAMGGCMNRLGIEGRHPLMLTSNHVQYQAGNVAAMATLFAWYAYKYRGTNGQYIDISMMETQMASINQRMMYLVQYQYLGERLGRLPRGIAGGYPNGYFPCQDGYVNISAGRARWATVVELLKMPELLNDPRFSGVEAQADPNRREEFEGEIWLPWLLERNKMEVVEECQSYGLPAAPINDIGETMDHFLQAEARGFFVKASHPEVGELRYPGAPIYSPRGWWRLNETAPSLGQHTDAIMNANTQSPWKNPKELQSLQTHITPGSLPLEGVRILDMTMVWAGPYGTTLLADMGAEIIRLEPRGFTTNGGRITPAHPNPNLEKTAPMSPFPDRDPGERPWNRASSFNAHARNKHSITVDLSTPEGQDVFHRLVKVSDLFVQNNAVGSMERLGFTYDVLSELNPRFSMISVAGLGQTGPWKEYRGLGYSFESFYGFNSLIGYPDMDADGVPITAPSDAATGVTIATAALMALHQRERTGKGCFVDISLGEAFAPHMGEYFMDYEMNSRVPERVGNQHVRLVQNIYLCDGHDEWISLTISNIKQWHTLCTLMGTPALIDDPRLADLKSLRSLQDEIDEVITSWTKDKNNLDLFHLLQANDIPASPIMHEPMAYADPHLKERDFFVPITQADTGTHLYPGTTYKISGIPFTVRKPPVRLGEDNDYVYREVLGLSDKEYDRLKSMGMIGMDYLPGVP